MVKAVFTARIDSKYDDLPEVKYHFPKSYLNFAEDAVGDWVVYYEPRRKTRDVNSSGGRQVYYATAKVTHIAPDPELKDHFYAFVSDYLEFDRAVPFKESGNFYESGLQREDGGTSKGAFGRAVRHISDTEYSGILNSAFTDLITENEQLVTPANTTDLEPAVYYRPLIEHVSRRLFRDAAFSRQVKQAYDNTCAFTGIQLINGGGRSEVQAAHIRPVADLGPDSVRNGIALSGTVHWMFDRGLISLADDYSILTCNDRIPDPILGMFNQSGRLNLPGPEILYPHKQFMYYHRENVFKG